MMKTKILFFSILITISFLILAWEWIELSKTKVISMWGGIFFVSGLVALFLSSLGKFQFALMAIGAGAVIFIGVALVRSGNDTNEQSHDSVKGSSSYFWLAGGLLYIGLAVVCLIWLRNDYSVGRAVFFIIVGAGLGYILLGW